MDPRSLNNLIIPGWMVFEMELKNTELRVYALIYGFSQHGEGDYHGSLQYLADWCGIKHRSNVLRLIKKLQSKGLLLKYTDKEITPSGRIRKRVHYQAVIPDFGQTYKGNGKE